MSLFIYFNCERLPKIYLTNKPCGTWGLLLSVSCSWFDNLRSKGQGA